MPINAPVITRPINFLAPIRCHFSFFRSKVIRNKESAPISPRKNAMRAEDSGMYLRKIPIVPKMTSEVISMI